MAWVDDDRKVCFLLQNRDALQIQCVSGISFKSTDSAFAEDDILVSGCHDVLCGHDPLFIGRVQASF